MKLARTTIIWIAMLGTGSVAAHAEGSSIAQAEAMKGEWKSISCKARNNKPREPGGTPTPSYLKRHFVFDGNQFTGALIRYSDAVCEKPIFTLSFDGQMVSKGPSPAGNDIEMINHILDRDFRVEPLTDGFTAPLIEAENCGTKKCKTDVVQSILEFGCPMMRQSPDQILCHIEYVWLFMADKTNSALEKSRRKACRSALIIVAARPMLYFEPHSKSQLVS